ncbi:MAG: archaellin/type IV pilin N-terminal domain-containing protein [Nanoarchaeota archaeon]
MFENKRGVSNVVATVLLVLLTIAAVVIVWQVIKPMIEGTGEKIEASCIYVDLGIDGYDDTSGSESVTVSNDGSVDVDKVRVVVHDESGGVPFDSSEGLKVLETKSFDVPAANLPAGNWTKIEVAGVIGENICTATELEI